MKIRAITLGFPLDGKSGSLEHLRTNLEFVSILRKQLEEKSINVQTVRFCSLPFTHKSEFDGDFFSQIPVKLEYIDTLVKENLVDYYSFIPGLCDQTHPLTPTQLRIIENFPQYFKDHSVMFSSIQVSSIRNGISLEAIKKCAWVIKKLSDINAFKNLQFAATFNVPPNTPFFPSAYHQGVNPKITIALEAADEMAKITQEFSKHQYDLKWLQDSIVQRFTAIYDETFSILKPFCIKHGIKYGGMDFSPSPYPIVEKSIGTALENIKLSHFGDLGTIFVIGLITSAIEKVKRPKIGFSGFMQPLLEDYIIAKRHSEGKFDLTQLLLNSTVCGLGLDTIPLPGNVSEGALSLLMMDVAMLSTRLNKPLTCRLMPISNKKSKDYTEFDFEYFTNSKICDISDPINDSSLYDLIKHNSSLYL
ncbi:MAG: DUF711 family protein [Candidatus Lokiarchaeota archaeon]|nr:DUF711 family protein [Candidatus Lokiarchaeota archaeon]